MDNGQTDSWRIIVPTRDSARWIGAVARHYRRAGLDPLFVYDARSRDATLAILKSEGFSPLIYEGGGADIVEGGIMAFGVQACASLWVLRMDDDEFPSVDLITFLAGLNSRTGADAYFVSRRELFRAGGTLYYSRCRYRYFCHGYGAVLNPQLRLFRPSRARFVAKLHSPGLEIDGETALAPGAAFYAHLTFLIRDAAERLDKVRDYDALDPGLGWLYADEYLPELTSVDAHRVRSDNLAQFAPLIDSLPKLDEAKPAQFSCDDAEKFKSALAYKWRLYFEERGGQSCDMDFSSGSPVATYGRAPPPTIVVTPHSFLPLAAQFGEFDFIARADALGWLTIVASKEYECIWIWGKPEIDALTEWLRGVARTALPDQLLVEMAADNSGGLVRVNRRTGSALKLAIVGLASLPVVRKLITLLRPKPLRL